MNKAELVAAIATETGITKLRADKIIDAVTKTIVTALCKGERVTIKDFGSFSTTNKAARNGRNPQTGATVKIKAAKVPKFSPGKEFKDIMQQ